jgi:hypothetical protein
MSSCNCSRPDRNCEKCHSGVRVADPARVMIAADSWGRLWSWTWVGDGDPDPLNVWYCPNAPTHETYPGWIPNAPVGK